MDARSDLIAQLCSIVCGRSASSSWPRSGDSRVAAGRRLVIVFRSRCHPRPLGQGAAWLADASTTSSQLPSGEVEQIVIRGPKLARGPGINITMFVFSRSRGQSRCQPPLVNRRMGVNRLTGGGEQFASDCAIHHPGLQFPLISENRSKSARLRAICDRRWDPKSLSGGANRGNSPKPIPPRFA